MDANAPELTVHVGDARAMRRQRDELLTVYCEVYADRLTEPFFVPERFRSRLEDYGVWPGFALVTGRIDGELIGFASGYRLPARSTWWRGFRGDVDPELLTEDGGRTFALTEIMIRASWRRQGYARALHDALLADRPEKRAALLVLPDNVPALTAYRSWGWYKLGELRPPFDDAPVCDAMVREL